MQKGITFDRDYFVKQGKKGAKKRNKLHNASEVTKRGWATRRANLDKKI